MSAVSAPSLLREWLRTRRIPDPCALVIFGATGDLTRRKLVPSLYTLSRLGMITPAFAVVGVARRPKSDEVFRNELAEVALSPDASDGDRELWDRFAQGLFYVQGEFRDPEGYARLREILARLDRERGTRGNRIYYLATAPEYYTEIIENLAKYGLVEPSRPGENGGRAWARVIVEKPFGRDLASARDLNHRLLTVFREDQIYRIDHYLGKETVQNILVFRFANGIFEPLWSQHYVDHIQITVAESGGIEDRGGYYDSAGVVRDLLQNHMMQLLTLVAMECPVAFDPDAVRDEKVKVLRAARRIAPGDIERNVVLGQYGPGTIGHEAVRGYRQESRVAPDSRTPTFVALRLQIDNWRWAGVPFYLRSGKRLPRRVTEVAVQFKQAPLPLFRDGGQAPNLLTLNIQPEEGISLRFIAKAPGMTTTLQPVNMDFLYGTTFGREGELSAYERLLHDSMLGDPTLFTRRDEVEEAWDLLDPVLTWWEGSPAPEAPLYPAGTWGPKAAEALIGRDGRGWRNL